MKNPYAKTVKFFSKCEDLFINRAGDVVYISDGHMILKLHVANYDAFFRPVSGLFLELADGEKAAKRGNMNITEKNASFDLVSYFQNYIVQAAELVNASPFLMEFTDARGKNALQRMFTGEGYYVSINNTFYEIARENGFTNYWSKGGALQPVVSKSGDVNGILILPIRMDQTALESFVNVAKK